jgi:hypothetical protein
MSPWLMVAWSLQLAGILRLGFRLLGTSLMAAGNSGQYIIAQNKDRPAKYPLVFYYIIFYYILLYYIILYYIIFYYLLLQY